MDPRAFTIMEKLSHSGRGSWEVVMGPVPKTGMSVTSPRLNVPPCCHAASDVTDLGSATLWSSVSPSVARYEVRKG